MVDKFRVYEAPRSLLFEGMIDRRAGGTSDTRHMDHTVTSDERLQLDVGR
jgi:hypothetical protein